MNLGGNIIMFGLMSNYELKIINQIYFKDIKNLKILNEKTNKFYDDDYEEKNKHYRVSIF